MSLKIFISCAALVLLITKILLPEVKIDNITIGLLVVAILPWLPSILESATLPGGWGIKFRKLEEKFTSISNQVAPIVDSMTESEQSEIVSVGSSAPRVVSEKESNILHALSSGGFPLRSLTGVSNAAQLDKSETQNFLLGLKDKGLAAEVQGRKGIRWAITPMGRETIQTM